VRVPALLVQPDGSTVVIRPLASGDEAAIAAWFKGLGPETRYARFLAGVKRLNDRTRSELARVGHRDREVLTAVTADRSSCRRDRALSAAAGARDGGGNGRRG
jgi:hypothetical protein